MLVVDGWEPEKVVNVASVPQRSPFRYPGGKTWLVPQVRRWFGSMDRKPGLLVEPFAGGGIISLTVAFENLAEKVIMVEIDEGVSSVWRLILGGDAEWLARRVLEFKIGNEAVADELSRPANSIREMAFQTLLRNRTNHGGILAPGSGVLKYGENGKGIASRWYPQTLAKRILAIHEVRSRIEFIPGDGLAVMEAHVDEAETVFFIDPPYTAGGKRAGRQLYTHHEMNHGSLFYLTSRVKGDFLMTYDNAQDVHDLAVKHGFQTRLVAMTNTHHAQMRELLIGKNLNWVK